MSSSKKRKSRGGIAAPVSLGKNPKDIAAEARVPMHLIPAIGSVHGAIACSLGAEIYGPFNWREKPISLMEYLGAMERHIARLKDGEDFCQDHPSVHHLGAINANTAILLDAQAAGTLIDDRPGSNGVSQLLDKYERDRKDGKPR